MNDAKQRSLGVALGYLSITLRNILGLLLIPFMIHHLGISEYGIYSLVSSLALYLVILELGLSNTTIRFISKYRAENDVPAQHQFLGNVLFIYTLIAMLVFAVGSYIWWHLPSMFAESLTLEEVSLLKQSYALLLLSVIVTLMSNSFTGIITAHEKFVFEQSSQISFFLLRCSLVVGALLLGYGVIEIALIDLVINVCQALMRIYFVFWKLKFKVSFQGFNFTALKEVAVFSGFVALAVIVNQINWRVDNLIIGYMQGSEAVAIFSVGIQLILCFIAFASTISNVFAPKIISMVTAKATMTQLTDELIKVGRMQLIVLAFVLGIFILFGQQFIQLFVGSEFQLAYWVALLPMIPFTLVLTLSASNALLHGMNKHKTKSLILLATACLNVMFSVFLVNIYGLVGAAIGTAATLLIGEVLLISRYLASLGIEIKRFYYETAVLMLPVLSIAIVGSAFIIPEFSGWFGLICQCLLFLMGYLVLIYWLFINKQEKQWIKGILNNVFVRAEVRGVK
ncbi:oligosaccharide flippase family protein [Thalassotalea montiporae]